MDKTTKAYLKDVLVRCLDDIQYRPEISFGENELCTDIRQALEYLDEMGNRANYEDNWIYDNNDFE